MKEFLAEGDLKAQAGEEQLPENPRIEDEIWQSEQRTSLRLLELFADWLFTAPQHELSSVIQKPLTPLEDQEDRD